MKSQRRLDLLQGKGVFSPKMRKLNGDPDLQQHEIDAPNVIKSAIIIVRPIRSHINYTKS